MKKFAKPRILAATAIALAALALNGAQAVHADETRINAATAGDQKNVKVASNTAGESVVVWQSPDGDGNGIFVQRYDSNGNRVGTQIQINADATGEQSSPDVGIDRNGNFTVVWQNRQVNGNGSIRKNTFYLRAGRDGIARQPAKMIGQPPLSDDSNPAVSVNEDGETAIVWQRNLNLGERPGSRLGSDIYAQVLGANGSATFPFRVNTSTLGDQEKPDVAIDGNGNFAVAWQGPQQGNNRGIYAQAFNKTGNILGAETKVSTSSTNNQSNPTIAVNASAGNILVAWQELDGNASKNFIGGNDTRNAIDIYARLLVGVSLTGQPFRVNSYTQGAQSLPSASMARDGSSVIAWQSEGQEEDGSSGIFAQRLQADGAPAGGEEHVNRTFDGEQQAPAVALDADGDYVVAWQSNQSGAVNFDTYGNRFRFDQVPETLSQTIELKEDTPALIELDLGDQRRKGVTSILTEAPKHGTLFGKGLTLVYLPDANYNGEDSFSYVLRGAKTPGIVGKVNLKINSINDKPIAQSMSVASEEKSVTITLKASDQDGDALNYSIVGQPKNGTLTKANDDPRSNIYIFSKLPRPAHAPSANDSNALRKENSATARKQDEDGSFQFKVNDGKATSNVATVSINDNGITNTAPVAYDMNVTVYRGIGMVLILKGTDADGDKLTYTVTSYPEGYVGSAVGISDKPGAVWYKNDHVGGDHFTYKVNDGIADSNTATVYVRILPINIHR